MADETKSERGPRIVRNAPSEADERHEQWKHARQMAALEAEAFKSEFLGGIYITEADGKRHYETENKQLYRYQIGAGIGLVIFAFWQYPTRSNTGEFFFFCVAFLLLAWIVATRHVKVKLEREREYRERDAIKFGHSRMEAFGVSQQQPHGRNSAGGTI